MSGAKIVCPRCKIEKPIAEFHKHKARRNGRDINCKDCKSAYAKERYKDAEYAATVKANTKRTKPSRMQLARNYIRQYLLLHPCITCGEIDPIVLEFDHRDPRTKVDAVSRLVGSGTSIAAIAAEIDKCDVLCANCHRRRTAEQFGWYAGLEALMGLEPT